MEEKNDLEVLLNSFSTMKPEDIVTKLKSLSLNEEDKEKLLQLINSYFNQCNELRKVAKKQLLAYGGDSDFDKEQRNQIGAVDTILICTMQKLEDIAVIVNELFSV